VKVLFAGASGTLGRALVPALIDAGHEVIGLTRHPLAAERLRALGVRPIVTDVLDRGSLLPAVRELRADAVLHQLTALASAPTHHRSMHATNVLRTEGTRNLVDAARQVGAHRIVTQSIVFGYGFGRHPGTLDERAAFGVPRGDATDETIEALAENERMVRHAENVEGVALRYGLFYGRDADTVRRMLRRRMLPVTSGGAVPLIHHDDAAAATVAALERGEPGAAYNIADDDGSQTWRGYLTDAAAAFGLPRPLTVPAPVLRVAVPYAARIMADLDLRVSSERAHRELGWTPRYPSAREGWRSGEAGVGGRP
jgi:nucleoside-diphosphate-sugar epimerase